MRPGHEEPFGRSVAAGPTQCCARGFSRDGRSWSGEFSWSAVTNRLLDLYAETLAER